MIKANIVINITDGENVYNIGDKVRVLMKNNDEYIVKIVDIQETFMTVSNSDFDFKVLHYGAIDKMKFAKDNENLIDNPDFE